jgi:two-component system sensor histidine kinase CreC
MSLRNKILVVFAGGLLLGGGLFAFSVGSLLRDSYRQSTEELMVDVSQLLAALLEEQARERPSVPATQVLEGLFRGYKARRFDALIFDLRKDTPGLDVYVTDARGIVLYSSEDPADVGRDFSLRRDVRLTLDGRYGSRSTRRNPADTRSSVFYVAAPVRDTAGAIVGSLSIIKQRGTVAQIVEGALKKMLALGVLTIALTLAMGGLLFQWITLPLGQLEAYARSISAGRSTPLPQMRGQEIEALGRAFEDMRVAVEGKKETERMAQALSHELKSPLSAIQGAAELLQEPSMEPTRKDRFLANIVGESERARAIVERLLEITALEAKSALDRSEVVALGAVVAAARDGLLGLYSARGISVTLLPGEGANVTGDPFLVQQCVRNLLQNAVEFSPEGGDVRAWIERTPGEVRVVVEDDGPGIPMFAKERVFEKFFSIERPSTGRKSSGLGLSFVKEVMTLHGGRVWLESPLTERGGTRAGLSFPKA